MPIATAPGTLPDAPYAVALATSDELSPGALTPAERRELARLPHDARRRDWLAGRCAAKRAVAAHGGLPPERVRLIGRTGASPRSFVRNDAGRWAPLPVAISIAHRDGVAIAAASSLTRHVGVDLERVDAVGPDERRYFGAPSEIDIDATLVWMLKEAAWKALGVSPGTPFMALRLGFDPRTARLRDVRLHGIRWRARAQLMRVPERRELVAAVVEIDGGAT